MFAAPFRGCPLQYSQRLTVYRTIASEMHILYIRSINNKTVYVVYKSCAISESILIIYNYSSWKGENVKTYMQNMNWNVQKGIFNFTICECLCKLVIRQLNLAFRVRNQLYLFNRGEDEPSI